MFLSERLSILVPGEPRIQPRGQIAKRGKFHQLVTAYAGHPIWEWRSRIAFEAAKALREQRGGRRFECAILSVLIVAPFAGTPSKRTVKPREWLALKKKDMDNFIKPLKDALTEGGVWEDDGCVVGYREMFKIRAAQGEQPHTRIRIEEAPPIEEALAAWSGFADPVVRGVLEELAAEVPP